MTIENDVSGITEAIARAYGSWEAPNFQFVTRAAGAGAWEGVLEKLRAEAELNEITDPNSEVCRSFVVRANGRDCATLQLSYVGSYGVLFRHDGPEDNIFITCAAEARNDLELAITRICVDSGVQLLGKIILEVPLKLALFDTNPERVRIYQALFTDHDFIPGEYQGQFG